jgi:hypothetical protein
MPPATMRQTHTQPGCSSHVERCGVNIQLVDKYLTTSVCSSHVERCGIHILHGGIDCLHIFGAACTSRWRTGSEGEDSSRVKRTRACHEVARVERRVETRSAMAHSSILRSRVSETTDGVAAGTPTPKVEAPRFPCCVPIGCREGCHFG